MLHRVALLLACLLLFLSGCASPSIVASGHVAADGRAFAFDPKYAGQAQGSSVSLVAEPEVAIKTEDNTHTWTARPFYRLDPVDGKRSHADIRQASYKLALEHIEASAGVGQFTWGVLESHRPTDVINQTDFVEQPNGQAKLGQPFAEVGYVGASSSLRLYYLPYFRERTFPGLRGRLRFPVLVDTDHPQFESQYGRWAPTGAVRFATTIGDFDFGVGAFTGLSREPRFIAELTTGQVLPRYDLLHQGSADMQWTLGPFVLKAEALTRMWTEQRRVSVAGGVGAEYTIFKVVRDADLSFAAEMLWDTRAVDAPPTFFEHDAFGGARFAFNDTASTEISAGAIVDVFDGTTFGRLEASRRLGDHWRISADGNVFFGRPGKLEGSFLKDDHLHGRIAYFF
jgi:hypothetical protein